MGWRAATWTTIGALVRRGGERAAAGPGAAIPGVLAPTIFFLGLTSVFGNLNALPGLHLRDLSELPDPDQPHAGGRVHRRGNGVNLARDIEQGWFDRLLVSPAPRAVLLAGLVISASLRSLIPATVLLIVGFSLGVSWPGLGGLAIAIVIVLGMGTLAACWGTVLALRFKSQSAAPLMQMGMLLLVLTTTAYAPLALLTGWLHTAARFNP